MLKKTNIAKWLSWFLALIMFGCGGAREANIRLKQKKYKEAVALYEEYLGENPDSLRARNNLGLAYLKAGSSDKAIKEFQVVLEAESCNPHATLYTGLAYLKKGEPDNALSVLGAYKNPTQPLVEEEVRYQIALLKTKGGRSVAETNPSVAMDRFETSVDRAVARQEEADRNALDMSEEKDSGGGGCFAYDTGVLMADGSLKRVIDLRAGDMVRAYDMENGRAVSRTVTDTYRADQDHYYLINGEIRITDTHPVFVPRKGWVEVADLKAGDWIFGMKDDIEISSIEKVDHDHRVYNFRVEDSHNYFVSADGKRHYLVHN